MAGGSNRRQLWPQLIANYIKASLCKSPLDTTFCLKSKYEWCDCFWILSISWKLLIMGIKVIWLKNKLWSAFWFQKQNYKNVVSTSQPNKQNNAHQENWGTKETRNFVRQKPNFMELMHIIISLLLKDSLWSPTSILKSVITLSAPTVSNNLPTVWHTAVISVVTLLEEQYQL